MKIESRQQVKRIKDNITQLTETLEDLSLELEALERSIQQESTVGKSHPDKPRFKLGDILQITNSYKGKKGTVGRVIHITKTRCTIVDSHGVSHTRAKSNLSRR